MLILTRKPGESIKLDLQRDADPATPIGEFFARGPIEIVVHRIDRKQVKLGIHAGADLLILREELYVARNAKP